MESKTNNNLREKIIKKLYNIGPNAKANQENEMK